MREGLHVEDARGSEWVSLATLSALLVLLGVWPRLLLDAIRVGVDEFLLRRGGSWCRSTSASRSSSEVGVTLLAMAALLGRRLAEGAAKDGVTLLGVAGTACSFPSAEGDRAFTGRMDPGPLRHLREAGASGGHAAHAVVPASVRRTAGMDAPSRDATVLLLFSLLGGMALVSAQEPHAVRRLRACSPSPSTLWRRWRNGLPRAPEGALKMFLRCLLGGLGPGHRRPVRRHRDHVLGRGASQNATPPRAYSASCSSSSASGSRWRCSRSRCGSPDTYQSAPTPFVAFLSVAPKAAGIATLFRLWFEGSIASRPR